MDFFGDNSDYTIQNQTSICFSGRVSDTLRKKQLKKEGKVVGFLMLGFAVLFLILELLSSKFREITNFITGSNKGETSPILIGAVLAVFLLIAFINFTKPYRKASINKANDFSLIFNYELKTATYQSADGSVTFSVDFASFTKMVKTEEGYLINYTTCAKRNKRGSFACQVSLMTFGSIVQFENAITQAIEENKKEIKERKNKVKKFAIISIILSILAVGLAVPAIKFGEFLFLNYFGSGWIFEWFEQIIKIDNALASIIIMFMLSIVALVAGLLVSAFAIIIRFLPIPLLIIALIFWVIQICINRKAWTWVSLLIFLVSLVGSVILMLTFV